MKNFVIGYFSYFDGTLQLEKVSANSREEALRNYLNLNDYQDDHIPVELSEDEIKEYAFDGDLAIEILEI